MEIKQTRLLMFGRKQHKKFTSIKAAVKAGCNFGRLETLDGVQTFVWRLLGDQPEAMDITGIMNHKKDKDAVVEVPEWLWLSQEDFEFDRFRVTGENQNWLLFPEAQEEVAEILLRDLEDEDGAGDFSEK